MDVFPSSFQSAQQQFEIQAGELGWGVELGPTIALAEHAASGLRSGHSLLRPAAALSDSRSPNALVITSGLHGPEGYFGSAVLFQLLKQIRDGSINTDRWPRIVLIHAMNPFGYFHCRRADEANRDLNRNFLLPGESFSGCDPLYRKLNSLLNPNHARRFWVPFAPRAAVVSLTHGRRKVAEAVAGGQHEFAEGLFFGGQDPAGIQDWLLNSMPSWLSGVQRVVHLDVHTGLGKYSKLQLLVESEMRDSTLMQDAQQSFQRHSDALYGSIQQ